MRTLTCPLLSKLDEASYLNLITHVFASGKGAERLFILGSNGEFDSLSMPEKKFLVDIAAYEVRKLKAKLGPIIPELAVGITSESLDETIELAQYAERLGADYIVLMPLYVLQNDPFCHGQSAVQVADTCLRYTRSIPLILYNNAEKAGRNLDPSEVAKLGSNRRVVACKDSSGDPQLTDKLAEALGPKVEMLVGDEVKGLSEPHDGIVAGSSNVLPVAWQIATKREIHDSKMAYIAGHLADFPQVYRDNPIGAFHYLLFRMGVFESPEPINPGLKVNIAQTQRLDKLLRETDFKDLYSLNH
ncbi:MAG: dihydrodipicolinate synthase family protein [Candidatus Woesearchaeota archaeon]